MKSSPALVETSVYVFWISSRSRSTSTGSSVVEDCCAIAYELHERGRALQLRILYEVTIVQLTVVEADRANVDAAALLGELIVDSLNRRLHALANRSDVSVEREPNALGREPQ